ncbi:MAG: response regulator transcription factor [Spirochaetales bacterium]|nr:response regulator transcription factor [Spirochaetales bacterium]
MKKKIVVVEDHPIVRRGIVQLINFEEDICIVGEAETAMEAHVVIKKEKPDLVLVDLSLKGGSGLELIKDLKKIYPELLIIVVSLHDENVYAERVMRAGAKGYIMKSEATESILIAIRQVLQGGIYLSSSMQTKMLNKIIGGVNSLIPEIDILSDREFEVFELIGKGFSTRKIADELFLSIKTIDTYKSHIKSKLNIKDSTELIQFATEWSIRDR